MNFKKILSSALTVVMLFATIVAFVPTKAEAAYSQSVSTEEVYTPEEIKNIVQTSYEYGKEGSEFDFKSAADALEYEMKKGYLDYVSSPDNKFTLYVNRYTGVFYYENNLTGEILTSNPYNVAALKGPQKASIDTIMLLQSQIVISFFETSNSSNKVPPYGSARWAAEYGQIQVSPIHGGLRVNYTLGDTSSRFLVPGQIVAEKFEKNLLKPMLDRYAELLENYVGEAYPEQEWNFFELEEWNGKPTMLNECVNPGALKDYCLMVTQKLYSKAIPNKYDPRRKELDKMKNDIMTFTVKYTLYNPINETNDKKLETMYKVAPKTEDGVAVYAFKAKDVASKRKLSTFVKEYCPDYTFQMMYEDEAECEYVYERDQKPVFRCSLEYSFNKDGSLSVRLPSNSISFDETVYTLVNITPLRYFGAGDITDEGYVVVPDGSGSVIEFEDFYNEKGKPNVALDLAIYGKDYCYSTILGQHREPVSMPVFGVVTKTDATPFTQSLIGKNRVNTSYFAILEEGSSLANLKVEFGGSKHTYGNVYSTFTPYPQDTFDLSDTISVGGVSEYTMVSESKYQGSYVTRYVMLSDEEVMTKLGVPSVPPTYSGMATYYREYLKANGQLTKLENLNDKLPLYIEALGSMEIIKKILTFPVSSPLALTTFENVYTMYDELSRAKEIFLNKADEYEEKAEAEEKDLALKQSYLDKAQSYRDLSAEIYDITNINFKLTGFSNGGMYFKYPTTVKWERVLGGKKAFNNLVEKANAVNEIDGRHLGIYPEFDFMYLSNSAMFDGVSKKANISRMVDNRYASKQVYNSALSEFEPIFSMIISSDTYEDLFSKFDKKYEKFGIKNISTSTFGSDLNSNFDEDNPINREESRNNVVSLLDKMVNQHEYSVMVNGGNIYSVKYADHIIDMCTDSSHYRYSSYTIPFVGMVLHGYVNYAGSASNYSGSPMYDMLHSIENGASLYFILCYQNTNFLKDDEDLNKFYGVDYENWFDDMVEQYAMLNKAIGDLQSYEIVAHRTLIAERVIDSGEIEANLRLLKKEFLQLVSDQLLEKINDAYDSMFGDASNIGRGIKFNVDKTSLLNQASEVLNVSVDDLKSQGFDTEINAIVDKYIEEYASDNANALLVELSTINYNTKYEYVTDSFADDKDYVYTDYSVTNDLVTEVTYKNKDTGDVVKFYLNYNIFSVTLRIDENHTYTLPKYGFIRIDD